MINQFKPSRTISNIKDRESYALNKIVDPSRSYKVLRGDLKVIRERFSALLFHNGFKSFIRGVYKKGRLSIGNNRLPVLDDSRRFKGVVYMDCGIGLLVRNWVEWGRGQKS